MSDEKVRTDGQLETNPISAWFLGPKAENAGIWKELLTYVFDDYVHWRRNYFPDDPVVISRAQRREHEEWQDRFTADLDRILNRLKAHFPFYSPRYVAHMLSEQSLPAVLGYFAGMLYNPNNVTDEAAPVTVELELEVGRMIAKMLGFNPMRSWAHICSGGTVANVEAFWIARTAQFTPLAIQEYCKEKKLEFEVKLPAHKETSDIRSLSYRELLSLRPNEAIFMPRKLAHFLVEDRGREPEVVIKEINEQLTRSRFNVEKRGFGDVLREVKLKPHVFAPATAHYCIPKACRVLGYGSDALQLIPVTSRFRMDVDRLRQALFAVSDDEYVAGVVAVLGSTEEGAIDPVHEVHFLRNELAEAEGRSFWLHVDGAWGGYVACLFRGHDVPSPAKDEEDHLRVLCNSYGEAIDAKGDFLFPPDAMEPRITSSEVWWNEYEILAAFLAVPSADSAIVDPHKLGYLPYPAGAVVFKNGLVTELVTQRAQYLSDDDGGVASIDEPPEIRAVGPYILEGSKPGASAAAAWLAHKSIPLNSEGHGKVIKTTLLSARRLTRYLHLHKHYFEWVHKKSLGEDPPEGIRFTFRPLFEPDTNVVCFVTVPMVNQKGQLKSVDYKLSTVNQLNRRIYEKLSISSSERGQQFPYSTPYFVSRTVFEEQQYTAVSIGDVLSRIGIDAGSYRREGLFVLRATVMNPLHYRAAQEGKDFLYGFLKHLHRTAHRSMREG